MAAHRLPQRLMPLPTPVPHHRIRALAAYPQPKTFKVGAAWWRSWAACAAEFQPIAGVNHSLSERSLREPHRRRRQRRMRQLGSR